MSFFTYIFGKGYTGGPDFSDLETFHFDLDGQEFAHHAEITIAQVAERHFAPPSIHGDVT
jgi:hypothetical protein